MKRRRAEPDVACQCFLLEDAVRDVLVAGILPLLDDLEDMRSAWNTCTLLRRVIFLPPPRWKKMWDGVAKTGTQFQRRSATHALLELARSRFAEYESKMDAVCINDSLFVDHLTWMWRCAGASTVDLFWMIDLDQWYLSVIGAEELNPWQSRSTSLSSLDPTLLAVVDARVCRIADGDHTNRGRGGT